MDFTIDDEQKALRDAVRALATKHAPEYGSGAPVGPGQHSEQAWSALAEMGALGLPFPESAGGFGASAVEVSLVASELGRAGVRAPYAEAMLAGWVLSRSEAGADALEALVSGERLVVPAFAEPGQAWSPFDTTITASGAGDAVTLTGTVGPVAHLDAAAHVIVAAKSDGTLGLYLVEVPEGSTGSLRLDGTTAVALATGDEAVAVLTEALCLGVVTLAGESIGAMDSSLTMTVDYLKTRKQFGVPLMTFQTLTQRASDMYAELELARSTAWFAAMAIAENPADAATASRAKVVTGQAGRRIGQEAIQLHGGIGMTAEYAVGHLMTRLTEIEHTLGDTRHHLSALAATVGTYDMVDVLA